MFRGNPNLKAETKHTHTFVWTFTPSKKPIFNRFAFNIGYTNNALTRGYTYNTTTGVRNTSVYNVDGNRFQYFSNSFSWQLGSQALQLRTDFYSRHTSSDREGFNTINARHFNYGVSGNFKLPKGFGISTDFTCYSRHGYGVDNLDTTDPIWNVRVSYSPKRFSRWVFMVDGFDMLYKLSNVNYAVTATGRTVAYTNTLPRYFLLSVQCRLNIQSKKTIGTSGFIINLIIKCHGGL